MTVRNMHKKGISRRTWFMLTMVLVMLLYACGGQPELDEESINYDFNLYYANSDYVETGDESLGIFIVDERKLEIQSDEDPWILMLEELKNPGSDQLWTAVGDNLTFNDVYVDPEDRTLLYIDLSGVEGGGSFKEGLFIGQIVKTAVVNSKVIDDDSEVQKVQFLIDGEITESLMGHYESSGPFGMEDI